TISLLIPIAIGTDPQFYNLITKEISHSETDNGIPLPFIAANRDYFDQAERYLTEFNYAASAD
ncbi:MAG: hypothetical protein MUC38_09770, partial [Cyclobacteriaceae bacterium]|nr:hypothetical protein [Cyclobacteriaceae bacterium]